MTLSVANSLWADQGTPLQEDYLTFLRRAFGATAEERDLGAADTAEHIDAWAAENTDGLIDSIAADLRLPDPATVLVLLNAVYYRMLRLPYGKHGRYGMEIMLPDDGATLTDLLASLDATRWRAAVDSLTEQTIDELALPRFEPTSASTNTAPKPRPSPAPPWPSPPD